MHTLIINRRNILLYYLLRFGRFNEGEEIATSIDSTPQGIARNLGLNPNQVSTLLKTMLRDALVERRKMHINRERQKKYVYRLTADGVKKAKEFEALIAKTKFYYTGEGMEGRATIPEIAEKMGLDLVSVMLCAKEDKIDLERRISLVTGFEEREFVKARLYGRAREMERLAKFENSNAKVCLIHGMEGMGKSTLLTHALASWKAQKFLFVVRREYASSLEIFLQKLSSFLVAKKGIPVARIENAEKLRNTIIEIARNQNLILAIDNFQQANKELREFILGLVKIALSYESGLKVVLASNSRVSIDPIYIAGGKVIEIELEPLPYPDALRMLSAKGFSEEDAKRIYEFCKGIPALLEIVTPEGLSNAHSVEGIRAHVMGKLSDAERDLLEAGALFTTPFEPEALFFVLGMLDKIDYDLLEALHERFVLKKDVTGRYAVQPFVARTVLDSMDPKRKEALHLRIGKYYEMSRRNILLSLAHFVSSRNIEEIEQFLFRNRYLLLNSGNLGLIEGYLSNLLEELRRENIVSKKIFLFYAEVLEALGFWRKAEAIYERLCDEPQGCLRYASMLVRTGSFDGKTREVIKKARELCRGKKNLELLAEHHYIEGVFAEQENKTKAAIRNYSQAIEICKKIHLPIVETYAWIGLARISIFSNNLEEARKNLSKAEALMLIASGEIEHALFNLALGGAYMALGDSNTAQEAYQRALKHASQAGESRLWVAACLGLSGCLIAQGRLAEAEKYFVKAEELRREINDWKMEITLLAQKLCFAEEGEIEGIIESLCALLARHGKTRFAKSIGDWAAGVLKWRFGENLPAKSKLLFSFSKKNKNGEKG